MTGRGGNALPRLSVIVPAYNEAATIGEILARICRAPIDLDREIIVVDDGSADATPREIERFVATHRDAIRVVTHERNRGKGAAIRSGLAQASGDIILIQDADLEYDPRDYPSLLEPILEGNADAVFGTRFHGGPHRVLYFWHAVGNRLLAFLTSLVTGLNLSDLEGGYKAYRTDVVRRLTFRSNGFEIEPEIVVKVAKLNPRVYEVPIRYYGRTYAEGKKISWRDGIIAIFALLRYRFFD